MKTSWHWGEKIINETHTIDNPMLVDDYSRIHRNSKFTGVVRDNNNIIAFYKNGKLHRENNPALIGNNKEEYYFNGLRHRENGPSYILGNSKMWHYMGFCFGTNDQFNTESWIKYVHLLNELKKQSPSPLAFQNIEIISTVKKIDMIDD